MFLYMYTGSGCLASTPIMKGDSGKWITFLEQCVHLWNDATKNCMYVCGMQDEDIYMYLNILIEGKAIYGERERGRVQGNGPRSWNSEYE